MATLHGLFVGINTYEKIPNGLSACLLDLKLMEACLRKYYPDLFTPSSILTLSNEEATKAAIVKAFEEKFTGDDVKPGDIQLLYFSGHGGEELADPYFTRADSHERLQNLVCYDSDLENGRNFLGDKELRYLIRNVSRPGVEFISIFDCCHSGDNTRSLNQDPEIRVRLCRDIPQRPWVEYIFAKGHKNSATGLSRDAFQDPKALDELLPEGYHIQLSACESHESAKEIYGVGGVFTQALIQTIEAFKGNINYFTLNSHIRSFIRQEYRQNPKLYIQAGTVQSLGLDPIYKNTHFKQFLSARIGDRPVTTFVRFDASRGEIGEWVIDAGGVYGIKKNWKGKPQRIPVYDQFGQVGFARVKDVFAGQSLLEFEPYADVVKSETYEAKAPSLLATELKVFLKGNAQGLVHLQEELPKAEGLRLVDNEEEADFAVLAREEMLGITLPKESRPLAKQVQGFNEAGANELIANLKKVGKWWFAKTLQNEQNPLPASALNIEVRQEGNEIPIRNGGIDVNLTGTPPGAVIDFMVTNAYFQSLYISIIYLSSNFGVSAIKAEKVLKCEAGRNVQVRLPMKLEDYVRSFGLPKETFHLKIIASTLPFDVFLLESEGLDAPVAQTSRGIITERSTQAWSTQLYTVNLLNPAFDTLNDNPS